MDTAVKPVQTGRGRRQHLLAYSLPLYSVVCHPKPKSSMTHA